MKSSMKDFMCFIVYFCPYAIARVFFIFLTSHNWSSLCSSVTANGALIYLVNSLVRKMNHPTSPLFLKSHASNELLGVTQLTSVLLSDCFLPFHLCGYKNFFLFLNQPHSSLHISEAHSPQSKLLSDEFL